MYLFIDTTSSEIILALFSNSQIIDQLIKKVPLKQAELLLKEIDKFLGRNRIKLNQIKGIIVVRGPGSFTGTRIGLTVANTINFALKIPLLGIRKKDNITELDFKKIAQFSQKKEKFKKEPILPFYAQPPNITKKKKKI